MKKIRFFYGMVYAIVCTGAWALLARGAARANALTADGETERKIRVLIMDSEYQSYYHPSVEVFCGGQAVTYTMGSPELDNGRIKLDGGEYGISVLSVTRQEGNPVYQGYLEIEKHPEGLLLINELPVEQYLEAVVPSEMPADSPKEALKAQAVCARTYAYRQIEDNSLAEYGANVDDSVNYQVYYNIFPRDTVREAVQETKNQVMLYNGELIEAYYFSTSCGVTSTDEVWGADQPADYLKSVPCEYDSDKPWSRWKTEISWEVLTDRAQTLEGCGGSLKDLEVMKLSQNGAVVCLRVITESGNSDIEGEYEVRSFLSPEGCIVAESDGTETMGGRVLPSGYFSMEKDPSRAVILRGRGYGHGVGMSQTAACEMAKEGENYKDILEYFFNDIRLASTETF